MLLQYVDESGDPSLVLFVFMQVDAKQWPAALEQWLAARRQLRDRFQIPVRYELHAVKFLHGRGNPSLDVSWNRNKSRRLEAAEIVLEALAGMPVRTHCLYRCGGSRAAIYRAAIDAVDAHLAVANQHGLVVLDGDEVDPQYTRVHRDLAIETRRVLEDPWMQPSHSNQWIMMVDLVAHLAFQSLKTPDSALAALYDRYLRGLDASGGPVAI